MRRVVGVWRVRWPRWGGGPEQRGPPPLSITGVPAELDHTGWRAKRGIAREPQSLRLMCRFGDLAPPHLLARIPAITARIEKMAFVEGRARRLDPQRRQRGPRNQPRHQRAHAVRTMGEQMGETDHIGASP